MFDRRRFKGTSIFNIFKTLIIHELSELEEYINEIAIDLADKQNFLETEYKNANIQAQDDLDFLLEDSYHKYFNVFPVYTFNPLLLTVYGQFENWLKKLCDLDSRKGFCLVKVSDLSGNNYIEKSRKYFELIAEIEVSISDPNWVKIIEIQKIRNCIAHNNSNIIKNKKNPVEKQELFSLLLNDNRIEFNKEKGDFYIKDKAYLLEVIELIRRYLFDLIEKLQVKKVIAKNIKMPSDNTVWGQEKTEDLINQVIFALNLFDQNKERSDEFKDSDLNVNLRGIFESMTVNLTKIYAFFSDGKWEIVDSDYILKDREAGLKYIKDIYGINK